jgi:hypothetical protein
MSPRSPFQRRARSRGSQRAAGHAFFLFAELCEIHTPRHAVPSACSSVNCSPLSVALASSLSSSAPSSSCHGSVCIRNASSVLITHHPPQGAQRPKMQLDRRVEYSSTRGVRACTTSSRRLWQYSSDLSPEYLSLTIVFTLTRCALVGPATISQRTRATAQYVTSFARSARAQLSNAHSAVI